MAQQIHIPEPCHEDWDNMLPEANGRHCLQCCKTVVDFTGWEVEAIANYLKSAKGNTCGRFTADQVQTSEQPETEELARYVIRAAVPFYRKLAAMIVLFFGVSFAAHAQKTTGGPEVVAPHLVGDTVFVPQPPSPVSVMGAVPVPVHTVVDTPKHRPVLMGKPAPPKEHNIVKGRVWTPPKSKPKPRPKPAPVKPPEYLQGDVQIIDPPAPQQSQMQEEPREPSKK